MSSNENVDEVLAHLCAWPVALKVLSARALLVQKYKYWLIFALALLVQKYKYWRVACGPQGTQYSVRTCFY